MTMFKQLIIAGCVLVLFSDQLLAEMKAYTIDNKYKAAFPAKPQYAGEMGSGQRKHKSYNYTDEETWVMYAATYHVGEALFSDEQIPDALDNYVKGQAVAVRGVVKSNSIRQVNENSSAIFFIEYQYQEVTIRKFGIVSYKSGHFYQWTVQDFPSLSKGNAKNIFRAHLKQFKIH
ncbi:MAG: hypothetical protein L3J46_00800 [Kangiellaceae bacterium]|nr:hypothetical protein [Kangiellaceae bacterium]